MSYEFPITIITPTYNRAKYLPRLYKSLLSQTNKNFQWLIIDDGSEDNTKDVVSEFSNDINWEYHYKENGGKHTALNYSHKLIKGELICIVDSDDWLTDDAVETIIKYWELYEKKNISGITFIKEKDNGDLASSKFPSDEIVSNTIDFRINQGIKGDCCEVLLSRVFIELVFPVFKNERFVPEGYLWNYVGFRYNTLYVNKAIYICEYLNDGLTKSGRILRINNPNGCMEHCLSYFYSDSNRRVNNKILAKEGVLYVCYGKFAGKNLKELIKKSKFNWRIILCSLPGYFLFLLWKKKYKKARK